MAFAPATETTGIAGRPAGAELVVDWLHGLAESSASMSDAQRVEAIGELEELKARAAAVQARLSVDLDASQRQAQAASGIPAARQGAGVAAQVALARRESPHRGASHLGLAKILDAEMPHTFTAMMGGRVSEWHAKLLARETACLSREDRALIDELLCKNPDRIEGWGDRRLVAECRRLAAHLDAQACVERARRAEADRRVTLRPAPDTMSHLGALLPVAQGVALWAALMREADARIAAGDGRNRGQLMADTLVERVTGQSTPTAVPVAVNLTVSDETLLAGGSEPAWVQSLGQVPAGIARDLVATAVKQAHATLRRLYVTPATGRLTAMDSKSRNFPDGLGWFVEVRDQTCRTPWCDAQIRHKDHVEPVLAGGETTGPNGQGLCEACNHAKQAPGWRATAHPGPHRHLVEITTPTGHRHRSRAPAQPRPTPHPLRIPGRSRAEIYLSELLLAV